jgi:hypothetical protein
MNWSASDPRSRSKVSFRSRELELLPLEDDDQFLDVASGGKEPELLYYKELCDVVFAGRSVVHPVFDLTIA